MSQSVLATRRKSHEPAISSGASAHDRVMAARHRPHDLTLTEVGVYTVAQADGAVTGAVGVDVVDAFDPVPCRIGPQLLCAQVTGRP